MSYIPRSSMSPNSQSAIPRVVQKKHTFRVFGFIATLMIVCSIASFAGAFFYTSYLENQLSAEKSKLQALISEDETKDIYDLEIFSQKLNYAEMLLSQHVAPSRLFEALEKSTKSSIQLLTMEYTYDPGFQALLELGGGTDEIAAVASQNMEFLKKTLFTDFVTSDITIGTVSEESEDTHEVTFAISGALDKSALAYTGKYSNPIPVAVLPQFEALTEDGASATADTLTEDESIITQ